MLHRLAAVARTAPLAARVQTRALATTAPRAFKLKKSEWANDPTVAHDEFKKYSAQPTEVSARASVQGGGRGAGGRGTGSWGVRAVSRAGNASRNT